MSFLNASRESWPYFKSFIYLLSLTTKAPKSRTNFASKICRCVWADETHISSSHPDARNYIVRASAERFWSCEERADGQNSTIWGHDLKTAKVSWILAHLLSNHFTVHHKATQLVHPTHNQPTKQPISLLQSITGRCLVRLINQREEQLERRQLHIQTLKKQKVISKVRIVNQDRTCGTWKQQSHETFSGVLWKQTRSHASGDFRPAWRPVKGVSRSCSRNKKPSRIYIHIYTYIHLSVQETGLSKNFNLNLNSLLLASLSTFVGRRKDRTSRRWIWTIALKPTLIGSQMNFGNCRG